MSEEGREPLTYVIVGGKGGWAKTVTPKPSQQWWSYYALYRSGMAVQDFLKVAIQGSLVDKLMGEVPGIANKPMSLCIEAPKLSLKKLQAEVLKKIGVDFKHLLTAWKAGIGAGMGSSYASAIEQYYNSGQLLYAYSTLQYQTSVVPRMRRYWLSQYTPTVPDARMAWLLLKRGKITNERFEEYASYDGWDKAGIGYLHGVFEEIPNERTAFRLLYRGVLKPKEFSAYIAMNGWPKGWDKKLEYLYQWWPSAREAFTLWKRGRIAALEKRGLYKAHGYPEMFHEYLDIVYTPIPTLSQAAHMYLRNAISGSEYLKMGRSIGYSTLDAARLMTNWLNYPTTREAFYMHRRDIIDQTTRDKIYMAKGYLSEWWSLISENYQHIPNPINAYKMMMRGALSRGEFNSYIYQNGWPSEFADKFYTLYQNIPTSHEAFFMWKKGLLSVAERDAAYTAYGWPSVWHGTITKNYEYVPTLYDLFRLADNAEVDSIWATEVMRRRGLSDEYIAKLLPMITIRPLRNEIARQVSIWVTRYELGWATPTQLEAALDAMIANGYIQTTEKTLITEEAELKYEDELMSEQITIYMWRFRMAAITEAQYLQGLLDLGIRREKANLMVEEQVAMGYYGYY